MKPISFYHLTDLHYYANEVIGSSGKSYEMKDMLDQKCMDKSGAIIDAAFRDILEDKDTDIILISGDLTFDGEVQSHDELKKKLLRLKQAGKRVYITFATHDFHMHAQKFSDEGNEDLPKYNRQQLRELYDDFGYSEAISIDESSYSYCVQLTDNLRLLGLNDDGDFDEFCGYYNRQLKWIKEQVEDAHANGCEIIAMTHHPLLVPSPIYPIFSHKAMLGGYEFTGPYLADLGIEYILVGHTHIHDITSLTSDKGNTIYQVNTASLIAYPLAYRKLVYTEKGLDVKTLQVTEIDADLGGVSVLDYAKDHFTHMIRLIFDSIENDYEQFIVLSGGFSGNPTMLRKYQKVIQPLGKFLNNLTFMKLGKLLGCKKYVSAEIANDRFVAFMCQVILNMYSGTEIYSPDTAEYKAFIPMVKRLAPFIRIKDHYGNRVDLPKLMADVIYDGGIDDYNAFLPKN